MLRLLQSTAFALLAPALLVTPAVARENYALLVGASQYPSLD